MPKLELWLKNEYWWLYQENIHENSDLQVERKQTSTKILLWMKLVNMSFLANSDILNIANNFIEIITKQGCKGVRIREGGALVWLLHLPPKFYNKFSYSLAKQLWRLLLNFDWFECPNVSTINCNLKKDYFCVSSLGKDINLSAAIVLSL